MDGLVLLRGLEAVTTAQPAGALTEEGPVLLRDPYELEHHPHGVRYGQHGAEVYGPGLGDQLIQKLIENQLCLRTRRRYAAGVESRCDYSAPGPVVRHLCHRVTHRAEHRNMPEPRRVTGVRVRSADTSVGAEHPYVGITAHQPADFAGRSTYLSGPVVRSDAGELQRFGKGGRAGERHWSQIFEHSPISTAGGVQKIHSCPGQDDLRSWNVVGVSRRTESAGVSVLPTGVVTPPQRRAASPARGAGRPARLEGQIRPHSSDDALALTEST